MKKIILFSLMCMFLLTLVSAEGSLGTFKQSENIELIQYCDSCSYVTLDSVTLPNSTILFFNETMTKTGNTFNYTFTNTNELGEYDYNVCGDKSGTLTCENIGFEITPSGNSGINNLVFIIFLIVAIYTINLFGFFGKNEIMTLLGGMFLMFLGVYLINNGIIIYRDNLTNYFSYITIAWGVVSSLIAGYSLYENL